MAPGIYAPGSNLAGIPHLSPLLVAVLLSIAAGRPLGWIGFLLPVGPLLAAATARLAGRDPEPTWRLALGFSVVCGALIGGSWVLLAAGAVVAPLSLLYPLFLIAFLLGLVNFVLVSLSRSFRAWKSVPLSYPWIPSWLDRPLGITPNLKEM